LAIQVLTIGSVLLLPKPADAFFFSFTTTIGDIPRTIWQIVQAALERVALDFANRFITKFVNQVKEKYKIRNYLYYDQVLTDYYLGQFISDKITDPNLRQAYALIEAGYITGRDTGLSGQPDPSTALIPKFKKAVDDYYDSIGGVPSDYIA